MGNNVSQQQRGEKNVQTTNDEENSKGDAKMHISTKQFEEWHLELGVRELTRSLGVGVFYIFICFYI